MIRIYITKYGPVHAWVRLRTACGTYISDRLIFVSLLHLKVFEKIETRSKLKKSNLAETKKTLMHSQRALQTSPGRSRGSPKVSPQSPILFPPSSHILSAKTASPNHAGSLIVSQCTTSIRPPGVSRSAYAGSPASRTRAPDRSIHKPTELEGTKSTQAYTQSQQYTTLIQKVSQLERRVAEQEIRILDQQERLSQMEKRETQNDALHAVMRLSDEVSAQFVEATGKLNDQFKLVQADIKYINEELARIMGDTKRRQQIVTQHGANIEAIVRDLAYLKKTIHRNSSGHV